MIGGHRDGGPLRPTATRRSANGWIRSSDARSPRGRRPPSSIGIAPASTRARSSTSSTIDRMCAAASPIRRAPADAVRRQVERLQVLGEARDRLQGRAQLVAQRGDELRLGEIARSALWRARSASWRASRPWRPVVFDGERGEVREAATSSSSRRSGSWARRTRRTCRPRATGSGSGSTNRRATRARRQARGTAPTVDRSRRRRRSPACRGGRRCRTSRRTGREQAVDRRPSTRREGRRRSVSQYARRRAAGSSSGWRASAPRARARPSRGPPTSGAPAASSSITAVWRSSTAVTSSPESTFTPPIGIRPLARCAAAVVLGIGLDLSRSR